MEKETKPDTIAAFTTKQAVILFQDKVWLDRRISGLKDYRSQILHRKKAKSVNDRFLEVLNSNMFLIDYFEKVRSMLI